jgi:DNA-binding beta-propeller fold protein YncE
MPIGMRILLAASAAVVLFSACSQPPQRLEPDNLVWPLPPNPPRIRYLQSIYTEDDIGRVYSFREKLFGKSYFDGMARPYGVSVKHGRLLVSDIVLRRVLVFDLEDKRLFNLGKEGGFQVPAGAVADAAGAIYVADSGGGKVAVYDRTGGYRTAFRLESGKPVGLAVNDALQRLYVVDRAGHRVIVFGLDGRQLFAFGGRGTDDGKLNLPLDIAIDGQGQVYVLDSGNFRVQIFSADGAFQTKFGMVGDGPGMFANPKGVAVDSDGHIYVTDAAFRNFQIFDRQGNILLFVGEAGNWPGSLQLPGWITID